MSNGTVTGVDVNNVTGYLNSPRVRQITLPAALIIGFLGIVARYFEFTSNGAKPIPAAFLAVVISLSAYTLIPITFPTHRLYDWINTYVGMTWYQGVMGTVFISIASWLVSMNRTWLSEFGFTTITPGMAIFAANTLVLLTFVVPGYLALPMTSKDAHEESVLAMEARFRQGQLDSYLDQARDKAKFRAAILGMAENGTIPKRYLIPMAMLLFGNELSKAQQLSAGEQMRMLTQLLSLPAPSDDND